VSHELASVFWKFHPNANADGQLGSGKIACGNIGHVLEQIQGAKDG
jgi:hypothetical protein